MHLPAGREMRKESLPAYVSFIPRCALPISRIGRLFAGRSTWPPSRMVCEEQAFQNSACMSPPGTALPIPNIRFRVADRAERTPASVAEQCDLYTPSDTAWRCNYV